MHGRGDTTTLPATAAPSLPPAARVTSRPLMCTLCCSSIF